MKYRVLAACFAFLAAAVGAQQQEAGGGRPALTLEAALESALANNPDLHRSAVTLGQARRAKAYGWTAYLPSLSSSVALSNAHTLLGEAEKNGEEAWSWDMRYLTVGASVTLPGDIPTQFKLLDNTSRKAEESYTESERSLVTDVSTRFNALLAAKMNIAILRDDLGLKKALYEQASANYKRGVDSELTMLRAQLDFQQAGPALEKAESSYRQSLAAFLLLIGMDANDVEVVDLAGEIEIRPLALPPASELVSLYLAGRSDVRTAEMTLEEKRLTAAAAAWKTAPTLSVSESVSLTQKGTGFVELNDPAASGTLSLTLSIPVQSWIPGTQDALTRKSSRENAALAAADLETARKSGAQDIFARVDALSQAAADLESKTLSERVASRAYELSSADYRLGKVSQTDLQQDSQSRVTAAQGVLEAKITYLTSVYSLATALGMSIEELYERYAE